MSTYYLTKFIKTDDKGKEHSFSSCFSSNFSDILDELEIIEINTVEHDNYLSEIKKYKFEDIEKIYIRKIKKLKKKIKKEISELKENLSRISCKEVYEEIKEEIGYKEELIELYKNDLKFARYIINGVTFFFSYIEDLYDTSDIMMETEIC